MTWYLSFRSAVRIFSVNDTLVAGSLDSVIKSKFKVNVITSL